MLAPKWQNKIGPGIAGSSRGRLDLLGYAVSAHVCCFVFQRHQETYSLALCSR